MEKLVRCNECNGTGHYYKNEDNNKTDFWNYKILVHKDPDGSLYFKIHEVFYKNGEPVSYSADATEIGSDTLHGVLKVLTIIERDVSESIFNTGMLNGHKIYYAGDSFPEEYTDVIGKVK